MSSEKVLSDMPHERLSDIQKELQDLLKSHLSESYPSEESAGSVFCKNGNINITITGEKSNLRNFWSGRISSTWTLTPAPPPSALTGPESSGDVSDENDVLQFCISGDIKIHAHYYEDGNVQLQSSRSFPSKQLNLNKELNTVAKDAMMHIKESEKSLQAGLQDMYLHMNEETFRQMRRLMPVTRLVCIFELMWKYGLMNVSEYVYLYAYECLCKHFVYQLKIFVYFIYVEHV
jgi:capping protein alpha